MGLDRVSGRDLVDVSCDLVLFLETVICNLTLSRERGTATDRHKEVPLPL